MLACLNCFRPSSLFHRDGWEFKRQMVNEAEGVVRQGVADAVVSNAVAVAGSR